MSKLATATVFINANLGNLAKGLADAERKTKASVGNITSTLSGIGKGMFATGAGIAAGITAIAVPSMNLAGTISDIGARTGLTAETITELGHGLKMTGSDMSALEPMMKGLSNNLDALKAGNAGAEKAFGRLGLAAQDFAGLTPDAALKKTAEAVAGIQDPMERAALAQDIFGKGGQALLPMLTGGVQGFRDFIAEAHSLGVVLSSEQVGKVDEVADSFDKLKEQLGAAGLKITASMGPSLEKLTGWLSDVVNKVVAWIDKNPGAVEDIVEWGFAISGVLLVGGPLLGFISNAITFGVQMKNMFIALKGVQVASRLSGLVGVSGASGLLGVVGALAAIVGVAGLAWAFGRWIDNITSNTAFGRWIDSMMDGLVKLIEKVGVALGLVEDLEKKRADNETWRQGRTPEYIAQIEAATNSKGGVNDQLGNNAAGTNFWRGGMTWVGERGPELVNLPRGSQVIPAGESARMAGGVNIGSVNITNAAGDTPRDLLRKFEEAMRLKAALAGA